MDGAAHVRWLKRLNVMYEIYSKLSGASTITGIDFLTLLSSRFTPHCQLHLHHLDTQIRNALPHMQQK